MSSTTEELEEPTAEEQLAQVKAENISLKLEVSKMKQAYWELHTQFSSMQANAAAQEVQSLSPGQAPIVPG